MRISEARNERARDRERNGRIVLAGALVLLSGGTAGADVIEIGPGGAVTHRGAVFTSANGTIALQAPRSEDPGALRAPAELARRLTAAGERAALSPHLLDAVAWVESRYNVAARSPAGAIGAMQLMPGTAAELGVDPEDADGNVRGGAAYLRRMLDTFDGDLELALAAYNAGPAAVRRAGGVPPYPETRAYVAAVLDRMAQLEEAAR